MSQPRVQLERQVAQRLDEDMGGIFRGQELRARLQEAFGAPDRHLSLEEAWQPLTLSMSYVAEAAMSAGYDLRVAMPTKGEASKIFNDADEDQDGKINLEEFVYLVQECSRAATRALNMTMMEAGIDTFRLETNSPGFEGEEEEEISHPRVEKLESRMSAAEKDIVDLRVQASQGTVLSTEVESLKKVVASGSEQYNECTDALVELNDRVEEVDNLSKKNKKAIENLAEFSEQLGQSVNQLSASNSDEHKALASRVSSLETSSAGFALRDEVDQIKRSHEEQGTRVERLETQVEGIRATLSHSGNVSAGELSSMNVRLAEVQQENSKAIEEVQTTLRRELEDSNKEWVEGNSKLESRINTLSNESSERFTNVEDGLLEVSRQQETNSQACMDMCSKTRDDLQAKQSEDVAALKTQVDAQLEGVRLECQGVESRLQERVSQEVQVLESAQTKHRADSSAEVEKLSQQLQEVERRANALEQSSTKEAERLQAQLSLVEGKQSNLEEDVAPLVEKYTQDLQAKVGVVQQDVAQLQDRVSSQDTKLEVSHQELKSLEAQLQHYQEENQRALTERKGEEEGLSSNLKDLSSSLQGMEQLQADTQTSLSTLATQQEKLSSDLQETNALLASDRETTQTSIADLSSKQRSLEESLERISSSSEAQSARIQTSVSEMQLEQQTFAGNLKTLSDKLEENEREDHVNFARIDELQAKLTADILNTSERLQEVQVEGKTSVSHLEQALQQVSNRTQTLETQVERDRALLESQGSKIESLRSDFTAGIQSHEEAIREVERRLLAEDQAAKKELSEALTASGTTLSQQLDAKVQELTAQQEAVTAQAESRFKTLDQNVEVLQVSMAASQTQAVQQLEAKLEQDVANLSQHVGRSHEELLEEIRKRDERIDELERTLTAQVSASQKHIETLEERVVKCVQELEMNTKNVVEDLLKRMSSLDGGMGQLHQENGEIRSRLHCVEQNRSLSTSLSGSFDALSSDGALLEKPKTPSATNRASTFRSQRRGSIRLAEKQATQK